MSRIQGVLLIHLKAGFEKKAKSFCDRDGYRPDTLGVAERMQHTENKGIHLAPDTTLQNTELN